MVLRLHTTFVQLGVLSDYVAISHGGNVVAQGSQKHRAELVSLDLFLCFSRRKVSQVPYASESAIAAQDEIRQLSWIAPIGLEYPPDQEFPFAVQPVYVARVDEPTDDVVMQSIERLPHVSGEVDQWLLPVLSPKRTDSFPMALTFILCYASFRSTNSVIDQEAADPSYGV